MHTAAAALIQRLKLERHPEGGWYREIHRSSGTVDPRDGRGERACMTVILFLLEAGDRSAWHRVRSDESWHFAAGDPLELRIVDETGNARELILGVPGDDVQPVGVVAAGAWQSARSRGGFSLVSCAVAPGFDFSDFEMLDATSEASAALDGRFDNA